MVYTNLRNVELLQNHYDPAGDNVILKYRHAADQATLAAAGYVVYAGIFLSAGYVQIRLEATV